jgi:hypothetical protein
VYSIAPSPLDANLLWVGTDDGRIWRTHDDGAHWNAVTPQALTSWSKVATLEAGHYDKLTAYAAVDRHRLEDYKPYIYRTRDGGKSWQQIANGIPDGAFVNVIREDPKRHGLLYAGTEAGIYISFDDGENWQSFQMNLPTVSVRDIAFHGDDIVIATFGRSFWVLDDVTSLREVKADVASEDARFFKPQVAVRTRPGTDEATPYPPEIAHGDNPAVGAIFDYYLKDDSTAPVTLEIFNAKGESVRKFSSDHNTAPPDPKQFDFPAHWVKLATPLLATKGMHRFVWDLHTEIPGVTGGSWRRANGVWVLPGEYKVVLTVAGKSYAQPLTLKMDPRVKTTPVDLQQQYAVSQRAAHLVQKLSAELARGASIEKQLGAEPSSPAVESFKQKLTAVLGKADLSYGSASTPVDTDTTSLRHIAGKMRMVLYSLQSADLAPTTGQESALAHYEKVFATTEQQWNSLVKLDLQQLNQALKASGAREISKSASTPVQDEGGDDDDR